MNDCTTTYYKNERPCDKCERNLQAGGAETGCMCGKYRCWFAIEWRHVCEPFRALQRKQRAGA